MGTKVLSIIVAVGVGVVIGLFITKIKDDRTWKAAADPNHEYHWYWVRVHERIENEKERKKAFLSAVSLDELHM